MIRIAMAAATAALMFAAIPASAQSSGTMGGGMNSGMSSSDTSSMTCADMMTKAKTMSAPTDSSKAMMAKSEMKMASRAEAKNDEATCKTHMTNAMNAMM